jgi:hypothetical protein
MAEALARRGDADEVREIELLAHSREQVERKLQNGGLLDQGPSHGAVLEGAAILGLCSHE